MITIKIGGSVVDNLHPSTISDIKKIVEQEGVILAVSYTHLTLPTILRV